MARATCPSLERAPLMAVIEDLSREKQRYLLVLVTKMAAARADCEQQAALNR